MRRRRVKLLAPTRSPPEMGAAVPPVQAVFTVASSEPRAPCSPLPRRTAPSASAWLEMCPASPPSVLPAPVRPPRSRTAAPVLQGGAISRAGGMQTGPCSVGVTTSVPPASARTGKWNAPSLRARSWTAPARSGGCARGSAASAAGSPRPRQAARSTTTGPSFRWDRSGRRATPVSYASARQMVP